MTNLLNQAIFQFQLGKNSIFSGKLGLTQYSGRHGQIAMIFRMTRVRNVRDSDSVTKFLPLTPRQALSSAVVMSASVDGRDEEDGCEQ
jgi:hypothetical protein